MRLCSKIDKMLIEFKITPSLNGFQYIKECLIIILIKRGKVGGLFRCIYNQIAREYETTVSSVERAIRTALDIIWENAQAKVINKVVGINAFGMYDKPSITQFLTLLAEKLTQEYYFNDCGEMINIVIC